MGTTGPVLWILTSLALTHSLDIPARVMNPAHKNLVCSTWGNFHYKTFDGDIYQFPGTCNYLFTSNCKDTFEDFNIQMRHEAGSERTAVSKVMIKIAGLVIELKKDVIMVAGERVNLPYSYFGVQIQFSGVYVKVSSKLGVKVSWNEDDSLTVNIPPKYTNSTCGLCGNMNGLTQDEFTVNNIQLTPVQFGNLQKLDGPTEQCEDYVPSAPKNCSDLSETCVHMLSNIAFSDCDLRVSQHQYVEACVSDLCMCQSSSNASCFCDTLSEYSRQCAHAGGKPQNWRADTVCERTCSMNMKYNECGSPCTDTCSNSERTLVCEDHCIDGCFCPPGTVLDDVDNRGCIPLNECSCTYNNKKFAPGEFYNSSCHNCTCQGGQWSCKSLPCAGRCSLDGGSHIYTYDGGHYNFHGDCSYIFTKDCVRNMFTVLTELRKCGVTDTETCLKRITLSLDRGQTVLTVKSSGTMLLNGIYARAPLVTENLAVFQPSSFFLVIHSFNGIQIQVQLTPVMQISVRLDPEYQGAACGLCGDFNKIGTDDFKSLSGALEGTSAAFANTWKSQADCNNVKNIYENPCALSVDNERFAQYWCSHLLDSNGPFAPCHAAVNPTVYEKNCMYDSCNYEKSEDSVCAALSAYAQACAAEGVTLVGWRGALCEKYTKNCPKNSTYQYSVSTCQKSCRSLSEPDPSCSFHFSPLDGCACPDGTFFDDNGACVSAKYCPCYYKGSVMPPGEVIYDNGAMCTCQSGRLLCVGKTPSVAECPANMVYIDCANASVGAKGVECQRTCQTLDMECFSIQCASGCVCQQGLVLNNNGSCVPEEDCPCVHNGNIYHSGESILQDCNTCTCKDRKWKCTNKECQRTCVVYGVGHYITFDGKRFDFSGDCEYTLTQDYCASNPGKGSFRVITENIECGTTGASCSKSIKLFLGNFELILSEGSFEVVKRDIGGEVPYQIRMIGIYLVIEAKNGLTLMWDKKTSILIKLSPEYKGNVCGLCGNYDGSVSNDFTTRTSSVVVNIEEFGNSWKASQTCPDAQLIRNPCIANPYRQTWSQKRCSIIMGSAFSKCHSKVDPTPYQEACIRDTCGCDSGGDCECFCTAVSAYASACSDAGICVSWRTPEVCPMFCDYYNPEGECDWHYKPCGAPCLKTCRNPSGKCMNQLSGLEGCYPKCPKARPFFDEDIMKCVAQADCGCYDEDDKRYNVGDMVPTYKNCESCICTKKGRRCQMDVRACYCYYSNMKFTYGDIIYNTTDGIGGCITATCSSNGTIHRSVTPCSPTTKAAATTFHFDTTTAHAENMSTPVQASPTSVSCLEEVCKWSIWYDITCPKYGENEGDFETFKNIRNKGHTICKIPSQVECRAQKFPKIPIADLGQIINCNTSVGLVCHNRDQFSQLCFNYEIRVLCCSYVPCGEPTNTPTSDTMASSPFLTVTSESTDSTFQPEGTLSTTLSHSTQSPSSIKATSLSTTKMFSPTSKITYQSTSKDQETIFSTPCKKQQCLWTTWYDVHFPSIVKSDGDFETLENIRAAGNSVCQKPREIECRAERFPNKNITEVGQVVTCDITRGLICNNKEQDWNFPLCYNYKVKFLCCSMNDCESSTTYVHSTIKDTSSTVKATSSPSTSHTDYIGQETGTQFQMISVSSKSHKTTPGETTTDGHISVSTKSTAFPSVSTSKTTMVHIPTMQTSTLVKTTSRSFESLVTSKYVTVTKPTSQKQDTTSQIVSQFKPTGISKNTSKQPSKTTVEKHTITSKRDHDTTLSFSKTDVTHFPTKETKSSFTEKSTISLQSTTQEGDHTSTAIPRTSKVTTGRTITTSEINCIPVCQWSQWFDVSFPNLETNGDFETYEEIKKSGFNICQEPSEIKCRSADLPDISLEELQQNVQCNVSYGLVCQSEDQSGPFPYCYNYEISVLCCSGCASTKVLPTFTYHKTSESSHEDNKTSQKPSLSQTIAETGKLTTFEEIQTYAPLSTKTTKIITAPLEITTTKPTATSKATRSMPTEVFKTSSHPATKKVTSTNVSAASQRTTTENEHEESTTQGLSSIKTTKKSIESGKVTSVNKFTSSKPITTKSTSPKVSTASHKLTTELEHKESTSHGPVSIKATKMSTESGEVTFAYKSTSSKPTTTKVITHKVSTASHKYTTELEQEKSTYHGPTFIKTSKMSTESGEVTPLHKSTSRKPITTKVTFQKVSTTSYEYTTESNEESTSASHKYIEFDYEQPTFQQPISIKTTKISKDSGEATSVHKSTSSKPKTTSNKISTVAHKSTTESEHEKLTSHRPVSVETTKMSAESGEVTSVHKFTSSKPITTKATSPKISTASYKSTTEAENEASTSHRPDSIKTTKMFTESSEVTSVHKSTSNKLITTKSTSPNISYASRKSTTETEHEESTFHRPVSIKTTKMFTESGEVTSVHISTSSKPITTKAISPKQSTTSLKSTTKSEHGESTSHRPDSTKTTKMFTESSEVTSVHRSTSSKPISTKATSHKISTASHISTTEFEHGDSTSHRPVSIKTTKMSTESGEVTSVHKSTSSKPITTKTTSHKISTASHKPTTESEHEEPTSHRPVSIKTTKMSTESGEVTYVHNSTSSKPINTKTISHKISTASSKSTTESEHKESTSHTPVSIKTTKMSTESGEVTSVQKSTSSKPITTKATSHKISTASHKPTTEFKHEESTSHRPDSTKTTKMSTESGEVTSVQKSTSSKPISTKATSHKISTASHKPTTESEHEESTSHRLVSIKTTKMSTESGEVTSVHKSTSSKPISTKATSHKISTASHKSTTEFEHGESTSHRPVSIKTTKLSTESGEGTSVHKFTSNEPITTKATSDKISTEFSKSTSESEHGESTSHRPVSIKTTKMSTESGEVTSVHKSTSSKPITTNATSYKISTKSTKSTTESEHEESTSHRPVPIKTTKMSTEPGEVTSVHKSTSSKPITTKATSHKISTASHKSTSESEHEESTSHRPVSIKTTKMSTESGEVTSVHKSTSSKPITTKATSHKISTASHKSTTESEHEESTSHRPVSIKTTKLSTESGEVTSVHKSTSNKPIYTKTTFHKISTAFSKSTSESEHGESTSHRPVSIKTTKMSTESGEVTSVHKSTSSKPITTKTTSHKISTASHKSTTESEHEESTSHRPVSIKTTKMSTESGEVTSFQKSTSSKPITTKATSHKISTASHKSTTEPEHEESTSHKPVSIKTTKVSTESGEVTSVHKSTSSKPITTKTTFHKISTASHKSTTESEHEESTSHRPVSIKTTKMSTESGEVTSVHKSTSSKPITAKTTSHKISTASHKPTTESEHEESTSHRPVSIKTTKMSTESGEVSYVHKSTSSKPISTKATSHKISTASHKSTTEFEHGESTSHRPVSIKTTKMSTESGEASSVHKSTSSKPITTNTTSHKISTASHKPTTESEHEESTSHRPVSFKTTKMSTESGEVTSVHKSTSNEPITTKATSHKISTAFSKSTSESEHGESTSHRPVSIKTTKMSTESGEVTSVRKSTSSKPITTNATSHKISTVSHKSTTESEHEESTSHRPVSIKTTKMSTESGEVTSVHKSTSSKPITTKATSHKIGTTSHKSTTEFEHGESTSHRPVSIKTTKISTESGEVTSVHKSTSSKPITTNTTSHKISTASHKPTTESEHEESTSHRPVSFKTTKMSTESGEVTSVHKSTSNEPITTKATSHKISTAFSKSTSESEHGESTSHRPVSIKTTKMSTESGEVTSVRKSTSSKPITTNATSHKISTVSHKSTTESEHEESTSHRPVSIKTTKMSTESGEVTSVHKSTSSKPITTKATSHKIGTTSHKSTTEFEHGESTSHRPVSIKTTKISTESGEVTSVHKSTSSKPITTKATSHKISTTSHKSTTKSEHEESTSHRPISIKTTKMSTESGEVSSVQRSTSNKPITTKATSHKISTTFSKSTSESEHGEFTSHRPVSIKTTKLSSKSGEVTSVPRFSSSRPITTKVTSPKQSTTFLKSSTESEHEDSTSHRSISIKTTKMSTESGEISSVQKSTLSKPVTTKETSHKISIATSKSTTESEHGESTSHKPISIKTTKMSTEFGEVTFGHTTSRIPITSKPSTSHVSTALHRSTTESEHSTSHGPISKQSTLSTFERKSNEVTKTSRPITAVSESFSTTRCMCNFNGTIVPPGKALYNTTDNEGWCFYARCSETCQVERYSEHCSTVPTMSSSTKTAKTVTASTATTITAKTGNTTKTTATSTKTVQTKTTASSVYSTSTPTPACSAVMPPRKVNETWMIDQCTHATCIGQNNIVVNKKQCAPINAVVCANRLKPKQIFDESGCCYQNVCECVCGGWGSSHYITFDGTYYAFNGQCTYILVQQITPVFDHFRVYIDNFSCDPDDPSCVKTLRIMYNNDSIVLTSQSLINQITNKIYINNQRVYPAIQKNGITITSSGIFVVVEIPEIGAYISFNVLSFTVKLPINKFSGNTEGHCGKCSNNQVDDCILPNGQQASSCTQMAGQWGVPSLDSSCSSITTSAPTISSQSTLTYSSFSSTYFSTLSNVPQTLPTIVPSTKVSLLPSTFSTAVQTIEEPCNTPELCKVILSSVFEECRKVVPPEPFYQACVSDGCTKTEGEILCSSLQSYARLCGIQGVCVDWRNSTNGLCLKNCSSHLVYKPCGPAVEPTCNSRYNHLFYNKTTEDYLEGCYCPENTTKFNTISDKCVTTCGCTGPDGMPREPGDTWESNCQTCICDNTTMSVKCVAKSCATPIPASCTEEGSMPVSVLDSSNPCCYITECHCNISLCSNVRTVCELGYEAVLQTDAGGCCPVYKCVPKDVCVHNGSEYQTGGIVPSFNPCERCICDGIMNETSGMQPVTCTPVVCNIRCAEGFIHQEVSGQCCGTCVQAECVMDLPDNSTYLLNPGETWSPPGDNCTEYECVKKEDKLLTVASKKSCPKINIEDCVPGTIQKDTQGCCLSCVQETNKCQRVKTEDIILQNGCKSLQPVVMSYCKGSCESYSRYSEKSQSFEHKCGCCQETETETVTIDLSCSNGEITKYSFVNVKSCSCADSTCNKEKQEGGRETAPVTKLIPQNTVKVLKATKLTNDSKAQHSENTHLGSESTENKKLEQNSSEEKQGAKSVSQIVNKMTTTIEKAVVSKMKDAEDNVKPKPQKGGENEDKSQEKQETKSVTKKTEILIQDTTTSNDHKTTKNGNQDNSSEEAHESNLISQIVQKAMTTAEQFKKASKQSNANNSSENANQTMENKGKDLEDNSKSASQPDKISQLASSNQGGKLVTKTTPQSTEKDLKTSKQSTATLKKNNMPGVGK